MYPLPCPSRYCLRTCSILQKRPIRVGTSSSATTSRTSQRASTARFLRFTWTKSHLLYVVRLAGCRSVTDVGRNRVKYTFVSQASTKLQRLYKDSMDATLVESRYQRPTSRTPCLMLTGNDRTIPTEFLTLVKQDKCETTGACCCTLNTMASHASVTSRCRAG